LYSVGANEYCPRENLNRIPADVAARYGLYRHGVIGCNGWESIQVTNVYAIGKQNEIE